MMFTCEHISVELAGDQGPFLAVNDVSLSVQSGEIVDIVGESGAGKSTFLHALALLLLRKTGDIALDGVSASSYSPQLWRKMVALVQQKPTLRAGTVEQNLLLAWKLKVHKTTPRPSLETLHHLVERAGLGRIALDRDVTQLSVGQQARVAFMRTLLTHPKVLLLDEVDAALDANSTHYIGDLTSDFAQSGGIVLRVRHKLDDARACKRLVFVEGNATLELLKRGECGDDERNCD